MFVVDNEEFNAFMSDKEVRQEYEYIMSIYDLAGFVVKYGVDKVMNDLTLCASTLMDPRNFGPDND